MSSCGILIDVSHSLSIKDFNMHFSGMLKDPLALPIEEYLRIVESLDIHEYFSREIIESNITATITHFDKFYFSLEKHQLCNAQTLSAGPSVSHHRLLFTSLLRLIKRT